MFTANTLRDLEKSCENVEYGKDIYADKQDAEYILSALMNIMEVMALFKMKKFHFNVGKKTSIFPLVEYLIIPRLKYFGYKVIIVDNKDFVIYTISWEDEQNDK